MQQKFFLLSVLYLLISGCQQPTVATKTDTATTTVQDSGMASTATADNTRNSIDWTGTYTGTTPCANCAGIETSLQLNQNNTYRIATKYLGKKDTTTQVNAGSFMWDDAGSVITLQGLKDGPIKYKVGEDILIQYDLQGKEVTGPLADKYILQK